MYIISKSSSFAGLLNGVRCAFLWAEQVGLRAHGFVRVRTWAEREALVDYLTSALSGAERKLSPLNVEISPDGEYQVRVSVLYSVMYSSGYMPIGFECENGQEWFDYCAARREVDSVLE